MKTLKAKLLSALLLLLVVTIMVAASGWYASWTANNALSTVFVDRVKPLRDLKMVADLYAVNIVDTAHKVRNGNLQWAQGLKSVVDAKQSVAKSWKAYSDTYMDAGERKLATGAANLMSSGDGAVGDLTDILRRQDKAALDKFVVERLYPSIEPISDAIGKLVDLQIDEAQREFSNSGTVFGWAQVAMLVSLLAGAIAFAVTLWVMLKGIIQPLSRITHSMHALAGGNLRVEVVGVGRHDEIGEMASAVEVFKANGLEMERMKGEQLAAEKRSSEQRKAEMTKLADGFEEAVGEIIDTVSSASAKLESSAGMLTSTAVRSEELTTMVAAASEEASTNVQS
ncbi:MAG TPA: MCP four helix bundle domain-containing protein, partial [Bradyrhizobium sp.]